jgi:hypothetical protein
MLFGGIDMPLRQRAFLGGAGRPVAYTPVALVRALAAATPTPARATVSGASVLSAAGGLAEIGSVVALGGWIAHRSNRQAAAPWKHGFWWLLGGGAAAQLAGDAMTALSPPS